MPSPLSVPLVSWLSKLSYPRLFVVVAVLFGINLVVPDPIILVDEVLLGLATVALAKRKRSPAPPAGGDRRAPIDGQARRP
ncbi:DUF6116 family protein [Luteimonas sp. FCS-9]|uniref:DUF6116 family protein n=1 Tax=Luteimonas sp. FCS-9 TaxID=1547516 RepID=UPI00063ED282|nr:DUF6116 family protein [Luteimonas sp. FCS-9]KLJ02049.1 hypothetical protein WQ56_04185 [Luteimonas sp. FCS-9]